MKAVRHILFAMIVLSVTLFAGDGKKYGKDLTLKEKTELSEVAKNPASYEGKKILVEGTIVDVCEKRGCWIKLNAGEGYKTMTVKVNDGEIVFPMEAKGKKALVEGEVYSIVPTAQSEHAHEHESGDMEKETCSEEGSKTAEGGCCSGDKAEKVYMIKGLGAVIEM